MRIRARCRCLFPQSFALLALVAMSHPVRADDLNHQLKEQYTKKIFILRNFYRGDHLVYNSGGALAEDAKPGDWSGNGIVEIKKIHLSGHTLHIGANRLVVFARKQDQLSLMRPGDPLTIDVEFGNDALTPDRLNTIWSAIFLTRNDRFVDLVAEYWTPCIKLAITNVSRESYPGCHFSRDLANLLGAASYAKDDPAMVVPEREGFLAKVRPDGQANPYHVGDGVSPPKQLTNEEPEFTECARKWHLQGTLMLSLVVDQTGATQDIRVARPLGCDFEANAVQAVSSWKFKPAERNGQPVPVEIGVEVDFHLE